MPNASELFCYLIKRAGLLETDELYTAVAGNDALKAIDVPTAKDGVIKTNLFNKDQAKINSELKQFFEGNIKDSAFQSAMQIIDDSINPLIDELGDEGKDLKAETKTSKRVLGLFQKVKELEGKKSGSTTGEKKALQDKIDALNTQIVQERAEAKKKTDEVTANYENVIVDTLHSAKLSSYKFGLKGVSPEIAALTAKVGFEKILADKKIKLIKDGNNLVPVNADGTPYTENNEKVDYNTLVDKFISNSGLLEVSGGQDQPPANGGQFFKQPNPPANGVKVSTDNIKAALESVNANQ